MSTLRQRASSPAVRKEKDDEPSENVGGISRGRRGGGRGKDDDSREVDAQRDQEQKPIPKDDADASNSKRSIPPRGAQRRSRPQRASADEDRDDIEMGSKSTLDTSIDRRQLKPDGNEEKPRSPRSRNTGIDEEDGVSDAALDKAADSKDKNDLEKAVERGPLRILEPLRADPIGPMRSRLKNFERLAAQSLPEVHYIGSILHGEDLLQDSSDGSCVR